MSTIKRQHDSSEDASSVPRAARESERRQGFRAVGVAVSRLATPVVAKRGGGILVRLKSEWAAIIGDEWAALTWPSALGRDGALKLRAASTAALDLQHRAPLLIDRINLFFGRPVVTRLTFVQGPLPIDSPSGGTGLRLLAANEADKLEQQLAVIADPQLRAALAQLGRAVIASRG